MGGGSSARRTAPSTRFVVLPALGDSRCHHPGGGPVECTLVEPFNGQTHSPRIDDDLIVERLGKDDAEPNWSRQSTEADDGEREMFCKLPDMNSTSLWNTDTPTPLNDEDCGDDESEDSGDDAAASPCAASTSKSHLDRWSDVSETLIFFDWDDTLLPTCFIKQEMWPLVPTDARFRPVEADNEYFSALEAHTDLVRNTLCAAADVAQVAIVTLAVRPWVQNSADWYLPGLNMQELVEDLGILVIYAREVLTERQIADVRRTEGLDVFVVAKHKAMSKCLRRLRRRGSRKERSVNKGITPNVLSVGDSSVEREALQDLLWNYDPRFQSEPCCKTVKLMEDPSLEHLGTELRVLQSQLQRIVKHQGDIDVSFEVLDDIEALEKSLAGSWGIP
mmetsp:Transcript_88925/g.250447  ORF Transcript_88925/g.250447 Transcript_88925/m.250447 type:complete len:391 (-) Transcript_88925:93-1265(-)